MNDKEFDKSIKIIKEKCVGIDQESDKEATIYVFKNNLSVMVNYLAKTIKERY